jgi:hypothetical protein
MSNFLDRFDLDITLRDAALDPDNRPTRRMIANAAIGMDALDAYYAVREIREAAQWIHEGWRKANGSSQASCPIRRPTTFSGRSISAWLVAAWSRCSTTSPGWRICSSGAAGRRPDPP